MRHCKLKKLRYPDTDGGLSQRCECGAKHQAMDGRARNHCGGHSASQRKAENRNWQWRGLLLQKCKCRNRIVARTAQRERIRHCVQSRNNRRPAKPRRWLREAAARRASGRPFLQFRGRSAGWLSRRLPSASPTQQQDYSSDSRITCRERHRLRRLRAPIPANPAQEPIAQHQHAGW